MPGDAVGLQQDAHCLGDIGGVNFLAALRRDAIRLALRDALDQIVPLAVGRRVVQAVNACRAQGANVKIVAVAVAVDEFFDGGFVGAVVAPGPHGMGFVELAVFEDDFVNGTSGDEHEARHVRFVGLCDQSQ